MPHVMRVNSLQSLQEAQVYLSESFKENKFLEITVIEGKKRTNQQNRALHKYLKLLADALNDAGHSMRLTINGVETDAEWNEVTVKELIWRPLQQAIMKEKSTTRATTKDYPVIYENLNRHTASKLGVHVPWPSVENE